MKVSAKKDVISEQVMTTRSAPAVTLTLSMDVAQTLLDVTTLIGGNSTTSRRGHMDAVGAALRDAGVCESPTRAEKRTPGRNQFDAYDVDPDRRAIYFREVK